MCSVQFHVSHIRSGHLLCALLSDDALARSVSDLSTELDKISPESLRKDLNDITAETEEAKATAAKAGEIASGAVAAASAASGGVKGPTKTPALDQFTIDLTGEPAAGKIDPVLGRDPEIRQIIDILTRRRQNNPILTGEAGVGKTAVVEGFALRIAAGDVPPPLQNVALRTLDLGLLQAGAGVKGEFENRLKSVIEEVKASPKPIIMFIDEAHTMIGAGGQAGQGDAANLLKPALARGELRTIAATTWAEYKKYFEKDAALARRFQVVKVEEPDEKTGDRDDARAGRHAAKSITACACWTKRSSTRCDSRTATSPGGNCRTSRSACSTRPAARVAIGHGRCRRRSKTARRRIEQLGRGDRHPAARERRRAPITTSSSPELTAGEGDRRG